MGTEVMGEPTVRQRQDGCSIVELLVALTVFALVFAAVSIGIGRALEVNRGNRNRSTAAYLAARELEEVRARLQYASPPYVMDIAETPYRVSQWAEIQNPTGLPA